MRVMSHFFTLSRCQNNVHIDRAFLALSELYNGCTQRNICGDTLRRRIARYEQILAECV